MYQDESKERFLASPVDANDEDSMIENYSQATRAQLIYQRSTLVVVSFLIISLLANTFLLREKYRLIDAANIGRSKFSGLEYNYPVVYQAHTGYSSGNLTIADSLWEAIETSPIVVALSDDYAREHGLGLSARFPWDDRKGIYHVKAFHHLHCLKNLRRAYIDLLRGNTPLVPEEHVYHCLDTLYQDLICLADDTPMPTVEARHQIGNGQVRQCRDIKKLTEWTQESERNACYRMLDEYRRVPHSLEQFAFCDKSSQYYDVAGEYFEVNGHKDPYGLDG